MIKSLENRETEKIWDVFHEKLKRFIRKRVSDENNAEDILQEIFLKIHTHIGTLLDDRKLESWIYQITRNTIVDYYRTPKSAVGVQEIPIGPENLMDQAWLEDISECVRVLIDRLPGTYRDALELTEFSGLTQKEMGRRLGLSPSGAKSRIQRARKKLKVMLLECCHNEFDKMGIVLCCGDECKSCSK